MPRGRGLVVAAVAAAVWGVIAGWWMPRGPVTVFEALASTAISLAVGLLAGRASRSRWALLLAPLVFAAAVEVVRVGAQGPTVDAPHLSALGVLAFVLGRGVHGLFSLLPLAIGALAGCWSGRPRVGGWIAFGALAVVQVLVIGAVVIPARTARIDGGIAELTTVRSGEHEFGLMLRGVNADAPMLLYIPGPPGGSEIGGMRRHLGALEQHFVVATWDRRGGAKSYGALEPAATFTMDEEVRHALAVAAHLRERFRRERIYLVGASGGSIVGVLAVQQRPEFFHAYVGVGQAIYQRESDRVQYEATLAWARSTGETELERQLVGLGPPPYGSIYDYEPLLLSENRVFEYSRSGNSEGVGGATENVGVPEYTLLEKVHYLSGIFDSFDILYPRYVDVDLRERVRQLAVPVVLVMGEHEVPVRMRLAREWLDGVSAPRKEMVVVKGAGHRVQFERVGEVVGVLGRVGWGVAGDGFWGLLCWGGGFAAAPRWWGARLGRGWGSLWAATWLGWWVGMPGGGGFLWALASQSDPPPPPLRRERVRRVAVWGGPAAAGVGWACEVRVGRPCAACNAASALASNTRRLPGRARRTACPASG